MGIFFHRKEKEEPKNTKHDIKVSDERKSIKDVTLGDNKGAECFNEDDHMLDYFGHPLDYSDFLEDQLETLYQLGKQGYNISAYSDCSIPTEYYKEFAKLEDEGINAKALYQISQCCYRRNDFYGEPVNKFDEWVFNAWSRAAREHVPLVTLIPGDPNSWDAGQITAMLDIYKNGNIKLFNQLDSSYDPQLLSEIAKGCASGVDMSPCANPMITAEQARKYRKESINKPREEKQDVKKEMEQPER